MAYKINSKPMTVPWFFPFFFLLKFYKEEKQKYREKGHPFKTWSWSQHIIQTLALTRLVS